jgi:hypothetical protein
MDSKYIKAVLCHYFRFKRQCAYIATECGQFSSDFLAIHKNKLIEVEIKVSKADLNNDFKKPKHRIYETTRKIWVPNQFYFAVPSEMLKYAATKIVDKPYGLLEILPSQTVNTDYDFPVHIDNLEKMKKRIAKKGEEILEIQKGKHDHYRRLFVRSTTSLPLINRVKLIKRAKPLHQRDADRRIYETIIRRSTSELSNLYAKLISSD